MKEHDPVNHPRHYTSHPSGVECNDIAEEYPANLAAAIHYVWRVGQKEGQPALQDLRKAEWYLAREAARCRRRVSDLGLRELLRRVRTVEGAEHWTPREGLLSECVARLDSNHQTGAVVDSYVRSIDGILALIREEIEKLT